MMTGRIPIECDLSEFHNLDYKAATIDEIYLSKFIEAGHNYEQIQLFNYFEPNPMPKVVEEIKSHFSYLKHLTAAVNFVPPGNYLPLHADLYQRWREVFQVSDVNSVHRYIVMLGKSSPGQILQVGNRCYSTWEAGDYFGWTGSKEHAIYNFSLGYRYAIQLTGCHGK